MIDARSHGEHGGYTWKAWSSESDFGQHDLEWVGTGMTEVPEILMCSPTQDAIEPTIIGTAGVNFADMEAIAITDGQISPCSCRKVCSCYV